MGFRIKLKRIRLGKILKKVFPSLGALTGFGGLAPALPILGKLTGRLLRRPTQRAVMPSPLPDLEERITHSETPEEPEEQYQEVVEDTETGEESYDEEEE